VSLGGDESLELVRMRVTTEVEGPRARTLVDHIFYNPFNRAVEGTFRYPLPPESSVSYYAMFVGGQAPEPDFFGPEDELGELPPEELVQVPPEDVAGQADPALWGELRVGRVVPAVAARRAFEEITRRNIDPALLEEVAPNTFEARVFPIPARGYNRVLIAYDQTLPRIGERLEYLFRVPEGDLASLDLTLSVDERYTTQVDSVGDLPGVTEEQRGSTHLVQASFEQQSPGGLFAVQLDPGDAHPEVDLVCGLNPVRDEDFCYLRMQPTLEGLGQGPAGAGQAMFLLDTSHSEHPDRFAVDVMLLQAILEASPDIEHFNVLTFDAAARWLRPGWIANTPEERQAVLDQLQGVLLEGATDFGAALDAVVEPGWPLGDDPQVDLFLLTDGALTWGDRDADRLVARFEAASELQTRTFVYRTGLGAENLALFQALTRQGAVFNCLSEEAVPACAVAHQAEGLLIDEVRIEGVGQNGAEVDELLVAGRQATLFPGAQLTLAARLLRPGTATLSVRGHVGEQAAQWQQQVQLEPTGRLAPRAWAEIAVAQLLQTHDPELERLATALSQHYRMVNRSVSMLVLETDEEYEQWDLGQEQANLGDQSLAEALEQAFAQLGRLPDRWDELHRLLTEWDEIVGLLGVDGGELIDELLQLVGVEGLQTPDPALELPLVMTEEVPGAYVAALNGDLDDLTPVQVEAERRREQGDPLAGVRALSTLVERHPADPEAMRLVGYRLHSWDMPAEAGALFFDVLRRRPYEPQSYRDVASSLALVRPGLSALMYEAVLAGQWHERFLRLQTVVGEEYALHVQTVAEQLPDHPINAYLAQRSRDLDLRLPDADLRVTITWNTDNTDIDLWVTDPLGEKCYYGNRSTASGGSLLDDVTRGYGPERFESPVGFPGKYLIQAHYYSNNGNRLTAETYVHAVVIRHAGSPQAQVTHHVVALEHPGVVATITDANFR